MDAYPEDYVAHNLPLILLSGLGSEPESSVEFESSKYPLLQENGIQIFSDFPFLTSSVAEELKKVLLDEDASTAPWNSTNIGGGQGGIGFRIRQAGRTYKLPPRKANPPPSYADESNESLSSSLILHSPLSPLTPSASTFPDGLMSPLWLTKHQSLVPAAFVNFFPFTTDPNMSSLRDNQLKIEINSQKKEWADSGYKTRYIVVLVCEEDGEFVEVEERIGSIRRATNLDPRSIYFVPHGTTLSDLKEFAHFLLSSLQAPCVEYYRDLSKHARRKRNRGSIPPPTAPPIAGTSQTLTLQGWNVRYEFKLGVFAEFRQEMDAACRNYESAYEGLFGEEVFEAIAGWNPRFNDARLFADTLAIRIIRCLLWTGQTTTAVRSWLNHRSRTKAIVDRRGKGTRNYGWEAWEARWSVVMAQIMHRVELPALSPTEFPGSLPPIFVPPEKAIPMGERLFPWEMLHHEGYWYDRSVKHTLARRQLALQMPEEDRLPPGQSPASQIANKSYLYDAYLAPEPHAELPLSGQGGFNHGGLLLGTLQASIDEFSARQQTRKTEQQSLEQAKEYMKIGSWEEAFNILQPLWSHLTWRRGGWWELMDIFGWALRESAVHSQHYESIIRVDWELINRSFPPRQGWHYDIHKSLEHLPVTKPKPAVVLKGEDIVSCVSTSFVFGKFEGNVGEPLHSQLAITSFAHPGSAPIHFSEVKIVFEGSLRPVKLITDENIETNLTRSCEIVSVALRDATTSTDSSLLQSPTGGLSSMIGITNLSLGPGQTKVFDLTSIPREAGETQVASVTLMIEEEKFDLAYVVSDYSNQNNTVWWEEGKRGPIIKRTGKDRDTTVARILPKPPKIKLTTPNLRDNYYTDEQVALDIVIDNEEDEAAEVVVEVRLFGPHGSPPTLSWMDEESGPDNETSGKSSPTEGMSLSCRRMIGTMASSDQTKLTIKLSNTSAAVDYEVEISTLYHLLSDVETPISKTNVLELSFIRPFEANYEFQPRIHPIAWPDFFSLDSPEAENQREEKASGLHQKWALNSKMVSFASYPLNIEKVALALIGVHGGAVCEIGAERRVGNEEFRIAPEELRESEFDIDIQKISFEDRRSASLTLALDISWRREEDDSTLNTSRLAIPRFLVPMGEPRVLASARASETLPGLIHMDYTLENPSMHFLTFNLAMEASDSFGFSGPKTMAVQLVPLSRHTVRYNLMASKRGLWIQPNLTVVDVYFNKTLRVLPTEGMGVDKKGVLVWVDAEG